MVTGIHDASANTIGIGVDGSEPASATSYGAEVVGAGHATTNFGIGTSAGTWSIDEVGIWTKVLTSSEITTLWNSGAGTFYAVDWMQFMQDQVIRYAFFQYYEFGGAYPRAK
jgi:hypothetical protein